ncbi:MAG: hypothetical protein IIB36_03910 [Gemmatimonadetes bacterium]|nr:hypothetical protein [Gemmatimonadota bacterium]
MRSKSVFWTAAFGALALLVYAVPAVAHHAFGAEFDADAPIQLKGPIVKLEWVNPHSWIHIEITTEDGSKEVWMVEGGTPNVLVRRGLRRECLPIGTVLVVDGFQTKDHTLKRANGRDVTFPDGRKFFLGSSGTGAPDDGAEARSRGSDPGRC